ncbi:hypothetical protein PF007_g22274 [Phytophthora fragariae]|uniref:Pectate lyase n=1 Tax=Phytophthora fragariae TaxID=53985 RepID=A0A6A3QS97_9STRA|nr:hypothetical protein PF007_g22274 [Phytophthora fragariae]
MRAQLTSVLYVCVLLADVHADSEWQPRCSVPSSEKVQAGAGGFGRRYDKGANPSVCSGSLFVSILRASAPALSGH